MLDQDDTVANSKTNYEIFFPITNVVSSGIHTLQLELNTFYNKYG
jgi:hypothetical protein